MIFYQANRCAHINQGEPGEPAPGRTRQTRANQGAKYIRANMTKPGRTHKRANQANQGEPAPGSAPAPGSGQDQHQDQHQVKKPPEIVQKTINLAWNCTKNDQSAQKTHKNPKILSVYGLPKCIIADFSAIFADFRRFYPKCPKTLSVYGLPK